MNTLKIAKPVNQRLLSSPEFCNLCSREQYILLWLWAAHKRVPFALDGAGIQFNPAELMQAGLLVEHSRQQELLATPRTTLMPHKEIPPKWLEYVRQNRSDLVPEDVFQDFRDYWLSTGKRMADWDRTWMRWVRNTRTKPAARLPQDEQALMAYVKENGLPDPRPGETMTQYRARLTNHRGE